MGKEVFIIFGDRRVSEQRVCSQLGWWRGVNQQRCVVSGEGEGGGG